MNILFFMKPKKDTAFIYSHHTIRQAFEKMKHYNYPVLPVIEKNGKYAGTLREGDMQRTILSKKGSGKGAADFCRVKDVICGNTTECVNAYTEMEDLLQMELKDFISVVDDRGLFIGIVTRAEILKYSYIKKSQTMAAIIPRPQHSI